MGMQIGDCERKFEARGCFGSVIEYVENSMVGRWGWGPGHAGPEELMIFGYFWVGPPMGPPP
jgi:hypothetical protein